MGDLADSTLIKQMGSLIMRSMTVQSLPQSTFMLAINLYKQIRELGKADGYYRCTTCCLVGC